MIQRLTGPRAMSANALAEEVGVAQPTLSVWLREARRLARMGNEKDDAKAAEPRNPKSWSAEEKYKVVIEAATITEADLGGFLRKKGLHAAQLEEWRRLVTEGAKAALTSGGKNRRPTEKADKKHVRALERELRRKDAALAEMAALVTLKKKAAKLLWWVEDESTPRKNET
jgi:transposase-like protein